MLQWFPAMRSAMQLRARLMPYLYTSARRAYDTGISMVSPLYYYWPEQEETYNIKTQYMLGDDMMAVPVVKGMGVNMTVVSGVDVWIPPGEWIDWQTGQVVHGPRTVNRSFSIHEMGMFMRAGSILVTKVPAALWWVVLHWVCVFVCLCVCAFVRLCVCVCFCCCLSP